QRAAIAAQLDASAAAAADAGVRASDTGELGEAPRATRWTVKKLLAWAQQSLGLVCCRETLRKVLIAMKMSWKKGNKLLARACPAAREAFARTVKRLLREALHGRETLVFIDEAHIHHDADLGRTWTRRGEPFYVASSSPGLSKRVSFFGAYVVGDARVHVWPAERANGTTTTEMFESLRDAYPNERIRIVWDGASYHRSAYVNAEAKRQRILLTPLPAYSPDFMPVEALWRWLREEVTYNHCHNSADERIRAVARFEDMANRDPRRLIERLAVRSSLHPRQEKLRLS
ncbi:MAG: IS630 family transposase, partial [Polyangiaceae bacterium]